MQKILLFAVAGAGIILAGCNAGNHRHTMIPVDDPVSNAGDVRQSPATIQPERDISAQPSPKKPKQIRAQQKHFAYEQMTGVVSSGGVEAVPGKKSARKSNAGKAGKTVAPGGTYIVQRGDTPERIARRHKVRLAALMSANKLDEASARKLQVGQKLTIPAGENAVVKSSRRKSAVSSSNGGAKLEKGKYRVVSGDTPERIARKHKVRLRELLAANNLNEESARRLQIGQILVIPGAGSATTAASVNETAAPVEQKTVAAEKKEETPQVVPAVDSAEKDASKTQAEQPTAANDESSSDDGIWEATEDTTYAAAAAKLGVSEDELRKANEAGASDTIAKGSLIVIPKK